MDEQTLGGGSPPPVWPQPPAAPVAAEPLNPWFAIWVEPRATMRQILDSDPRRLVHLLAMLGGAISGFQITLPPALLDAMPPGALLGLKAGAAVVCAVIGLAALYLIGFLVRMTGGWLGGRGDFTSVRSAIAWANVPTLWSVLLLLPLLAFRGVEGLNIDLGALISEPGAAVLVGPLFALRLVITVWAIVIFLKCLGEAHRFSAWRALGAAIFAWLILGAAVAVPAVAITLMMVGMIGR